MRASIEVWTVSLLVLTLACQPPPGEVVGADGGSSEGPAPESTSAGSTTSPADGSTTAGSADGTGSSGGSTSGSSSSGGESSDGGSDDSSTGEPTDEPLGPFDMPEAAVMLNSLGNDDDPSLTGDLLEIYFASNRNGSEDVFRSTRASVDAPWDAPEPVDAVNSIFTETFPEVSPDGLVLLLASDRAGDLDVYVSQRASRGAPWSNPTILQGAATLGIIDWGATPVPDLTRVFLCRDVAGGLGQVDIWEAPVDLAAGMLGPAAHVPELSTEYAECSVSVSPSGREIFIESTRPIGVGYDWNLWVATRMDESLPWDPPMAVEELNGEFDEIDPWLSPDRRTLWFASGTQGTYDLYVAARR